MAEKEIREDLDTSIIDDELPYEEASIEELRERYRRERDEPFAAFLADILLFRWRGLRERHGLQRVGWKGR